MLQRIRSVVLTAVTACLVLSGPLGAAAPSGRPEDVGLSSERLKRIGELVQRHVAAGSLHDFENMVMQSMVGGTPRTSSTN